ncbi:MAG: hypothetical protein DRP81_08640 [Candidatus Omnitrophota bacterium]|nr:MAG: hypothetical protein DRP81_08640 [Candidatus Omnitrophota bacterium]
MKKESDSWMLTFCDLLMLLLTFFVLLYSMSSIYPEYLKILKKSFLRTTVWGIGGLSATEMREIREVMLILKSLKFVSSGIPYKKALKENEYKKLEEILGHDVWIRSRQGGASIVFRGDMLFDSGKAELKKECLPVLEKIAKVINFTVCPISIEGHTDDRPIHTPKYPSNWELSLFRASSVLKYFMDKKINPSRFSIGGYAHTRPLYPNNSEENRAKNRRVEIVFWR